MKGKLHPALGWFMALALAWGLGGCAWSPVEPYTGEAPRSRTIYLIASGWHTEIGIRAEDLSGPIIALRRSLPLARYFVFGWGERAYYMAPDAGIGDLLAAAAPGPSVLLVIPTRSSPSDFFAGEAEVFAFPVAEEGLDRVSQYLWSYLEKDSQASLRRLGDGPYPESAFYASIGTYSLGNTCNTWTAEALRVAGLSVTAAGVVFAHQVTSQVRLLANTK